MELEKVIKRSRGVRLVYMPLFKKLYIFDDNVRVYESESANNTSYKLALKEFDKIVTSKQQRGRNAKRT